MKEVEELYMWNFEYVEQICMFEYLVGEAAKNCPFVTLGEVKYRKAPFGYSL